MTYHVGDLVKSRREELGIGVIIDSRLSNQVLESMHTRHMINLYPNVYYVYFSTAGKLGPYYAGELEQISHQENIS